MQFVQQAIQQQQPSSLANTLDQILNVLAQRFGTPVAHLWKVLVQYQYVEGVSSLVVAAIFFLLTLISGNYIRPVIKQVMEKDEWSDSQVGLTLISALVLIGSTTAFVTWAYGGIQHLLAPEYFALQDILSPLKPSR